MFADGWKRRRHVFRELSRLAAFEVGASEVNVLWVLQAFESPLFPRPIGV